MSLQSYTQNVNNSPFGLANTNAPGSPYAAAYGRGVTSHLMLPVSPIIFDAQPQQFLDLQYLMAFATEEAPGDEIIWHENVWSRSPIVTDEAITAAPAIPGSTTTTTFDVTADSLNYVYVGQKIHFTDDNGVPNQVIVSNIVGNAVTVRSMVGVGIGGVAQAGGVNLTNGMTAGGDGFQTFSNPVRTKTVRRTNLIEKVGPEQMIWNRLERLKWKNQAQTNFMEVDMRNVLTQLKVSMCQRIWLGQYGEGLVSYSGAPGAETAIAKFTEGIVPSIINNGGAVLNSTMSTVWDDLTTGIFQTNFGPINNERVIFGTPEMLHALNLKQKAEFVRYSAGDKIWDLDFEEWRFGGQKLTLVPTQIWNDAASFPEEYARRLVVLQKSSVKLVTMRGVAMISQEAKVSQSRTNTTPFEIYDFERYTVEGMVGTKVANAAQNFIVDVA